MDDFSLHNNNQLVFCPRRKYIVPNSAQMESQKTFDFVRVFFYLDDILYQ